MNDKKEKSDVLIAEKMLMIGVNSSPFYKLTGMECTYARQGEARVRMPFKKELTHPGQIAHGGAIASVADSALSLALISLTWPNTKIATAELKINYLKPFKEGFIEAIGKIIKRGAKVTVGEVKVKDHEGDIVAVGLATFVVHD